MAASWRKPRQPANVEECFSNFSIRKHSVPSRVLHISPPGLLSTSCFRLPIESHEDQLKPPFPLCLSPWDFTESSNPTEALNTWTTPGSCYLTFQVFFIMLLKGEHNCWIIVKLRKKLSSLKGKHLQKNLTDVKVFTDYRYHEKHLCTCNAFTINETIFK